MLSSEFISHSPYLVQYFVLTAMNFQVKIIKNLRKKTGWERNENKSSFTFDYITKMQYKDIPSLELYMH